MVSCFGRRICCCILAIRGMGSLLQKTVVGRRRERHARWWVVLLAIVAALFAARRGWPLGADCTRAAREAPLSAAIEVCRIEYAYTQSPWIGAVLADVLQRNGDTRAAESLSIELLTSGLHAHALYTLGRIAHDQGKFDLARSRLVQARAEHLFAGELDESARDAIALAIVAYHLRDMLEALRLYNLAIGDAGLAGDVGSLFVAHLGAAHVLTKIGHFAAAAHELGIINELPRSALEHQQLAQALGNLAQEHDRNGDEHQELAVARFREALQYASPLRDAHMQCIININLAFSLAEISDLEGADGHLRHARELDRDGEFSVEFAQLEARIAFRSGDLIRARTINEQAYLTIDDDDDALEVCVMQARIALIRGDYVEAARWALRGVGHAEASFRDSRALRPWLAASRRAPYELWFVAVARGGHATEAVQVFDQLQALGVLDDLHGGTPAQTLAESAMQLSELERWLPSTSLAPLARAVEPIVQAATPGVDVLGLVVAEGDVWRVVASEGRLHFDDLGPFEAMRGTLRTFSGSAGDIEIANKLGGQLLPSFLMRKTKAPLHVVLDAAFEGLPVPALAREHRRLAELRPVIRAPRWPRPTTCDPVAIGHARVLADPTGDLAAAAAEARSIAEKLDEAPLLGRSATSHALLSAPAGSLLHVGLHAQTSTGSQLRLFDRPVSAAEISTMKRAPAVVVLAACESARTSDPALNDSLATAFLAAGARYVVATLRPIGDDQAYEVTHAFYEAGGAYTPATALAQVQADLSHSRGNQAWWSFAVFSNEACLPR